MVRLSILIVLNTNVLSSLLKRMLRHLEVNRSIINIASFNRMLRMNVIVTAGGAQLAIGQSGGANCVAFLEIKGLASADRKYVSSVEMNTIKANPVGLMEIQNLGNMPSKIRS